MLNKYLSSVFTTVWINRKNLKMNFLEYLMLVILFPLTYLVVSITSSDSLNLKYKVSGMFISVIISLFVNMQGSLIANANLITTRELYATYGVKPIHVFDGISIFHLIVVFPMFLLTTLLCFFSGCNIRYFHLAISIITVFLFLSSLSKLLGGLIKNPQIATPIISMCYMIIMIISPIYYSVSANSHIIWFNPFAWLCESIRTSFGMGSAYSFELMTSSLLIISIVFRIVSIRIFNDSGAIEKNTII